MAPDHPPAERLAAAPTRPWKKVEEVLSPEEAAALRRDAEAELAEEGFLQRVTRAMAQGCEVQHGAEAFWVLGPSAAGKSRTLVCSLLRVPSGALTLDGGIVRDASEAWTRAMALSDSKGLAGFSNYFKDYFKGAGDKVKAEMVHRAVSSRANVIIPDTASTFKHSESMLSKFLDAGYRVSFSAVYADRATCEARGRLRESEEGKKFSSTNWATSVQSILDMQALLEAKGLVADPGGGVQVFNNTGVLHRMSFKQVEERLAWHRGVQPGCGWAECRLLAGVYRAEAEDGEGRLFQVLPCSLVDETPLVQMLVIEDREVVRAIELRLHLASCALRPQEDGAPGWLLRLGSDGRACLQAEVGAEYPSLVQVSPIAGWSLTSPVDQDAELLSSLAGHDFCRADFPPIPEDSFRRACEAALLLGARSAPPRECPRALLMLAPSGGGKTTVLPSHTQKFGMSKDEAVLIDSSIFRDFHPQYRALVNNGQANAAVWYRAWPAAKDAIVAAKKRLQSEAVAAKKDVIISDTGIDLAKLLSSIAKLKGQGYLVHLVCVFADPREIVERGVAREAHEGKRFNRDIRKLSASFDAFAPAVAAVNGRFCLVRNKQGMAAEVYCEGMGGQQIQFSLKEAMSADLHRRAKASSCTVDAPVEVYLPPEDIAYIMEGNANVVCGYHGPLEEWQGCAVRLQKDDNSSYHDSVSFLSRVALPMFGADYVDQEQLVALSAENVQSIDKAIFGFRSVRRQKKDLDSKVRDESGKVLAVRVHDLTALPLRELDAKIVTVELKPKCGLVERPGLPSRYQLLQQEKLAEGKISRPSDYDPVKLLSKQPQLIHEALRAAFAEPQNNLRVFIDGHLVFSEEVKDQDFEAKLNDAGLSGKDGLVALLADILSSPDMALPERLKRIQAWAAGETSHVIAQLYGTLRSRLGREAADDILGKTESCELALEGFEACPSDESGIGLAVSQMSDVHARAHRAEWTPDMEREVIQAICRFLLGRTAHDVSILLNLLRLPSSPSPAVRQRLKECRFTPCGSLGLPDLWLRASVVDTDCKLASKIPEYATQLDKVAAAYYNRFNAGGQADGHEAVGGHDSSMRFEGAVVWKRDQGGQRGRVELDFLRWALDEPSCVGIVPELVGYRREGGEGWLVMTNTLDGLQSPAILDLKLGTRTWNTSSDPKKAESQRQKAASSTSSSLGVRVVGGRVLDPAGGFCKVGSKQERDITNEDELRGLLSEFLCSEALRASAVKKVQDISAWWAKQVWFAFYASSLLLAYDTEKKDECRINLIDFANCEPITEKSQDLSGVASGFETLARVLANLAPLS